MTEDPRFLADQLITCIGNKRALLPLLEAAVRHVAADLGQDRLVAFDAFSGSGVVARLLKRYSHALHVNDLERYAEVASRCHLTNRSAIDPEALAACHDALTAQLREDALRPGMFAALYSPRDEQAIQPGERVFYTPRNAAYLDTARAAIAEAPEPLRDLFLGPLLAAASVHVNTAGVFKGFYKDKRTGVGRFGGSREHALGRIKGAIRLELPVLSRFDSCVTVHRGDANAVARTVGPLDLAYLDPPYNQHPYGANYFMLNLLADHRPPLDPSRVSGIPADWNRSAYNVRRHCAERLADLVEGLAARWVLVSYSSEGFIRPDEMLALLGRFGRTFVQETRYNTFRGCRNLAARERHVKEYLFLLRKAPRTRDRPAQA
ncbi:MAG: DNA adenine methylase [Candidatus Sericytochromatia bacterium]|nr:DNA adenine methylase [Candidatus Sericytochromatia bacterium]